MIIKSNVLAIKQFAGKIISPAQMQRIRSLKLALKGQIDPLGSLYGLKLKSDLPYKILVGTHHKAGTYWLRSIFQEICSYHAMIYTKGGKQDLLPEQFDVYFQNNSVFNDLESFKVPFRGIHIIRDPRDIIISGCFYHQKADEKWLHITDKNFQGLTYQQKINSYKDLNDKILFEMEHAGKETITRILNWNYNQPSFYEIKYESLIKDIDLKLFHEIFLFLGFPGSVMPSLLSIAYKNSLFSKQIKPSEHVRSGKSNQWKKYFNPKLRDRFVELFGDGLIKLGYTDDKNWV